MHRYDIPLIENKPDAANLILKQVTEKSTVLEIGCGNGRLTRKLAEERCCRVTVIEKDRELYDMARPFAISGQCADIIDWPFDGNESGQYDFIIFADVLEHLPDPKAVLSRCHELLKRDGHILISVPNFAHNDIILQLCDRTLLYADTGIMDDTHLRIFTYEIARKLFDDCGYQVDYEDCVSVAAGCTEQMAAREFSLSPLAYLLEGREGGNIYQYVFSVSEAGKSGSGIPVSRIRENADQVERRIYFDCGRGYGESGISFTARRSEPVFQVTAGVPENALAVRFDPVLKTGCVLEQFQVLSSLGPLPYVHNGKEEGGCLFFSVADPMICVQTPPDLRWIGFSGRITCGYCFITPSETERCLKDIQRYEKENRDLKKLLAGSRQEKERLTEALNLVNCLKKQNDELAAVRDSLETEQKRITAENQELTDIIRKQKNIFRRQMGMLKSERRRRESAEAAFYAYKEEAEKREAIQENNCQRLKSVQASLAGRIHMLEQRLVTQKALFTAEKNASCRIIGTLKENLEKEQRINETIQEQRLRREAEAAQEQIAREKRVTELERQLREAEEISLKRDENISHLTRIRDELEIQTRIQELEIKRLSTRVEDLMQSTSWRVTSPFRLVTGFFKHSYPDKDGRKTHLSPPKDPEEAGECADAVLPGKLWPYEAAVENYNPLVSVIVPNYNHAPYLRERLDSVYGQTYEHTEILLLDDGSQDNSCEILEEYARNYPEKTRLFRNPTNSGSPFRQWEAGIRESRGELIWIAESDDAAQPEFLDVMVRLFAQESLMLAFCRTDFIRDGEKIWTSEEYLSDLDGLDFSGPFVLSAAEAAAAGFCEKNLIANVSSAVFRNKGVSDFLQRQAADVRLCADWMFYLEQMRGGCLAYTNEVTNYYRVHEKSTSLSVQDTDRYYTEYVKAHRFALLLYRSDTGCPERVRHRLEKHYRRARGCTDLSNMPDWFGREEVSGTGRRPHIIMGIYSMQLGGGETFPIYLADELRKMNVTVTAIDFRMGTRQEEVRRLLDPGIPLISLRSTDDLYHVLSRTDADVIHTHHASVDHAVAVWLNHHPLRSKLIITTHGMYDSMNREGFIRSMKEVLPACRKFIYIADKNLRPFEDAELLEKDRFIKIPNGLPVTGFHKLRRSDYGIRENDFVLVLASRAIEEKGWREAVCAVQRANEQSRRRIWLFLLGEGEVKEKISSGQSPYIRCMGIRTDVRAFLEMGDAGILPTYFRGESCPLFVIESLQTGRPVIATDVAEIRNQITDERGQCAGVLVGLSEGRADVEQLSAKIAALANDSRYYRRLKKRCASAARKFDMMSVAEKTLAVYTAVMNERKIISDEE